MYPFLRRTRSLNTHHDLSFNGIKLSIAVARTTVSHHLNLPELWFDSVVSALGVGKFVSGTTTDLRLVHDRLYRLRDFSRTARIGELAQGITFLFAQEKLGYPIVVDFDKFCSDNGIPLSGKDSTPDFVCQKSIPNMNVMLLESKGSTILTSTIKTVLRKGKRQCNYGRKILKSAGFSITNRYSLCTRFSFDTTPNKKSIIHFVDPDDNPPVTEYNDGLLKFHYASWFYLVGDFESVKALTKSANISKEVVRYEVYKLGEETYYLFDPDYIFNLQRKLVKENYLPYPDFAIDIFHWEYFHRNLNQIGIEKRVYDALTGEKRFDKIPEFKIYSDYEFEGRRVNTFADGTIILQKWREHEQ